MQHWGFTTLLNSGWLVGAKGHPANCRRTPAILAAAWIDGCTLARCRPYARNNTTHIVFLHPHVGESRAAESTAHAMARPRLAGQSRAKPKRALNDMYPFKQRLEKEFIPER